MSELINHCGRARPFPFLSISRERARDTLVGYNLRSAGLLITILSRRLRVIVINATPIFALVRVGMRARDSMTDGVGA